MTAFDPTDCETSREEPIGEPVVRGDPEVIGSTARSAVAFDPTDPTSVAAALDTVRTFVDDEGDGDDVQYTLRGAAACAALVRSTGSYTRAAKRAGDGVTVSFLRKWARVHDLPISIRRHIAVGDIAPTAAMHVARVEGDARLLLAWAILDAELTVDEVRRVASDVVSGRPIEAALRDRGVILGEMTVTLPVETYRDLRRMACLRRETPGDVVASMFERYRSAPESTR